MARQLIDAQNVDAETKFPKKYCCDEMSMHLNRKCNVHTYFECVDNVVAYLGHGMYGIIIHDGEFSASSVYRIRFCPWCGKRFGRKK